MIAVDIVDSRLEFAKSVGATHTINSRNEDPVARIKEITGGGADYALDATGSKVVFRQMIDSMSLLGHAAIVGLAKPGTESPVDIGSSLLSGASVNFILEGDAVPQVLIPQLIALYEAGRFPFGRLVKTTTSRTSTRPSRTARAGSPSSRWSLFEHPARDRNGTLCLAQWKPSGLQ
ncbi:zinc-binding dehydrogenase [Streptomyces sp. NPDC007851]|uniref:zinc-binding dehydrogenase n=1 Tax=Streptomyces sp. NPDC007851 TaxID=3155008 RepID=UPI0033C5808D